ncbi:hypothetical protein NDU88_009821 [Pleurodeles waltl]|uniref:40S ribosomal protein S19 n=1 Tax=Pleurodeles waltl TaxID=8319 RepID=A0AAV7PWW6_PLEWA|nr:hypothetical protein NDU88_009821 [Pleurodeles waltl]
MAAEKVQETLRLLREAGRLDMLRDGVKGPSCPPTGLRWSCGSGARLLFGKGARREAGGAHFGVANLKKLVLTVKGVAQQHIASASPAEKIKA